LPSERAICNWRIGVTLRGSVWTVIPGSIIGSATPLSDFI